MARSRYLEPCDNFIKKNSAVQAASAISGVRRVIDQLIVKAAVKF